MVRRSGYRELGLSYSSLPSSASAAPRQRLHRVRQEQSPGRSSTELAPPFQGATVNVTEAGRATVRTVVTDDGGRFRFAALNPGRYSLAVELASFRTLNGRGNRAAVDRSARPRQTQHCRSAASPKPSRSRRKSRPSRWRTARRRSTLTLDDIGDDPHQGRDIFGMLSVLPGVQDTNLNRDFTQWRSAISVTINGMPSQNKDVRVDGMQHRRRGRMRHRLCEPQHGAVGEVQVIANGYTAENGRNNGGVIGMVTKSGTNQLRASGWYNGRRDKFNENDYFRKAASQAKPLYRVNISGYSVGGPVVIPGLIDSRRSGGRRYISSARRSSPTTRGRPRRTRANMPTGAEYNGDFSGRGSPTVRFSRSSTRSPASSSPATRFRRRAPRDAACSSAASTRWASAC